MLYDLVVDSFYFRWIVNDIEQLCQLLNGSIHEVRSSINRQQIIYSWMKGKPPLLAILLVYLLLGASIPEFK